VTKPPQPPPRHVNADGSQPQLLENGASLDVLFFDMLHVNAAHYPAASAVKRLNFVSH
jgi:hypothetical protein